MKKKVTATKSRDLKGGGDVRYNEFSITKLSDKASNSL